MRQNNNNQNNNNNNNRNNNNNNNQNDNNNNYNSGSNNHNNENYSNRDNNNNNDESTYGMNKLISVLTRHLKADCFFSLQEAISDVFTDSTVYFKSALEARTALLTLCFVDIVFYHVFLLF